MLKILSISDVITNSSSEVFIMNKDDADYYRSFENGCISIEPISYSWILRNNYEYEATLDLCNLDKSEVCTFIENPTEEHNWWDDNYNGKWGYWCPPKKEDWEAFCERHKEDIMKVVNQDLYFVEIEDHFEGARDVTESAQDNAIWYENRH